MQKVTMPPEPTAADVQILPGATGGPSEALITRILESHLDIRVALTLPDGREVWVKVTPERAQELELEEGQIIPVRVLDARPLSCS
jgi:TOBE domain